MDAEPSRPGWLQTHPGGLIAENDTTGLSCGGGNTAPGCSADTTHGGMPDAILCPLAKLHKLVPGGLVGFYGESS